MLIRLLDMMQSPMLPATMRAAILSSLVIIFGVVVDFFHWAFDHFMWDWFINVLETKWHLREAELIASVSSYVLPGFGAILCLAAMYLLVRLGKTRFWKRQENLIELRNKGTLRQWGGLNDIGQHVQIPETYRRSGTLDCSRLNDREISQTRAAASRPDRTNL